MLSNSYKDVILKLQLDILVSLKKPGTVKQTEKGHNNLTELISQPVVNVHVSDLSQLAIYYPFYLHFLFFANLNSEINSSYYLKSLKANKMRKRKKLDNSNGLETKPLGFLKKPSSSSKVTRELDVKTNNNQGKCLSYDLEDLISLSSVTDKLVKNEWRELKSFIGDKDLNVIKEKYQSYSFMRNCSNSISFDFFYFVKRNHLIKNIRSMKTYRMNTYFPSGSKPLGQFPFYLILKLKLKKWKEFMDFTSNLQKAALIKDRAALIELENRANGFGFLDASHVIETIDKKPEQNYDFPLFSDILDIRFFEFITNSLNIPLSESQSMLLSFWTNFFSNPLVRFTCHIQKLN